MPSSTIDADGLGPVSPMGFPVVKVVMVNADMLRRLADFDIEPDTDSRPKATVMDAAVPSGVKTEPMRHRCAPA